MKLNWELVACGAQGHTTYSPDESGLRERLHASTPEGDAWRCLRCGTFVIGSPDASGPGDQAPDVLRGQALADLIIMRLLAVERLLRTLLFAVLGTGLIMVRDSGKGLQESFNADLPLLAPLANQVGVDLQDSKLVQWIERAFSLSPTTVLIFGIAVLGLAVCELIEAYGLWFARRWGEYFAVVFTAVFIPLEIYELTEKVTALRAGALIVNIAAVIWLIWRKRLFGVRGGTSAYRAAHEAGSLLTVDEAADTSQTRNTTGS